MTDDSGFQRRWYTIRCSCYHSLGPSLTEMQVKPYSFGMDSGTSGKPSDMLWSIFKAAIAEFGLNVNDFASCTTDDSFVVKAMCTSRARNFGITWDWCVSHMAGKACDDSFGNSVDPDSSNNQQARDIVEAVIKVAEKLNNSPAWRGKFGLAQVGRILHAPICFHRGIRITIRRWRFFDIAETTRGYGVKPMLHVLYKVLRKSTLITLKDGAPPELSMNPSHRLFCLFCTT